MDSPRRRVVLALLLATTFLLPTALRSQFVQQGPKLVGAGAVGNIAQGCSEALSSDGNTVIIGGWRDNGRAGAAWVWTRNQDRWTQQGKLVGSGAVGSARQGYGVAISADGNTAIVGGPDDVIGPDNDGGAGAAWIWVRSGTIWTQQGPKLVGSDAVADAQQGYSVAISADGSTAIIGGPDDNGGQGAAWVWTRSGTTWTQQGMKLVGSGATVEAQQGFAVAISGDGNTATVGGRGAAWMFTRNGGNWTQQGNKLVGTGALFDARQGSSVALSFDGNTALVGALEEGAAWVWGRSGATWTQQGPKLSAVSEFRSGQRVFVSLSGDGNTALISSDQGPSVWTRTGASWTEQAANLVRSGATNTYALSVALSADGMTVAAGDPIDNSGEGATWIWTKTGNTWSQQGPKLVASDAIGGENQGWSVAISADGNTAIVAGESAWVWTRSGAIWSQQGPKLAGSGRVSLSGDGNTAIIGTQVWTRSESAWSPGPNLIGTGAIGNANQGASVALSTDGNTAIVGGPTDNGYQGAAWVWTRSGNIWTQQGAKLVGTAVGNSPYRGSAVALSADGNTAIVTGRRGVQNTCCGAAAWVWMRSAGTWSQQGLILSEGSLQTSVQSGPSVALSADGNTAILGTAGDNGNKGAARIWTRSGSSWTQEGPPLIGADAAGTFSEQGMSVALSADGNTAIVCGDADGNVNPLSGATWVWVRSGNTWTQFGNKLVGTGGAGTNAFFQGFSVDLSSDGSTIIVGGYGDAFLVGAAWVFTAVPTVATTTTVSSVQNPSLLGQSATFAATILAQPSGSGTPNGNVAFLDGATPIGTVALTNGRATFSTPSLALGPHTISAIYAASCLYFGSTSSRLSHVVNPAADVSIANAVTSGPPYATGGPIAFLLTVRNNGPSASTTVIVTETVPSGATLTNALPSQGSCSGASTITCSLGTIAPGGTATITLKITAPPLPGAISSTATVSATEGDVVTANNVSTAEVVVVLSSTAIPTLSFTMLVLLAFALATGGLMATRR